MQPNRRVGSVSEPMAVYELDMYLGFAGPMPARYNRAAPEVTAAHREAVEAAQEVMRRHGFTIIHTCHGSRRIGTHLPTVAAGHGERSVQGYQEWLGATGRFRFWSAMLGALFALPAVLMWTDLVEPGTSPWVYWPLRVALIALVAFLWLTSLTAHLELRTIRSDAPTDHQAEAHTDAA